LNMDLDQDPLSDSDCFCLCCHSHHYTHQCYDCQQIECHRCFDYYQTYSRKCLYCYYSGAYPVHFSIIQIFPENKAIPFELSPNL
jgi:hypothetical protein